MPGPSRRPRQEDEAGLPATRPELVLVGHVALDVVREAEPGTGLPELTRIGGAVSFAAVTAQRLGRSVRLLTGAAADFSFDALRTSCHEAGGEHERCRSSMPQLRVVNAPSPFTTRFVNRYAGGRRTQRVLSRAADLDVPHLLGEADPSLVFIGPLVGEIPPAALGAFPRAMVAVAPQGWLRAWDGDGLVRRAPWPLGRAIPPGAVVVVSDEDLGGRPPPVEWETVSLLVVTEGASGARLRWRGVWRRVPAFPVKEVDPTGAGDVFATALLLRLDETRDPLEAARFASAAAGLSVEGEGVAAVPCRARVEALLAA